MRFTRPQWPVTKIISTLIVAIGCSFPASAQIDGVMRCEHIRGQGVNEVGEIIWSAEAVPGAVWHFQSAPDDKIKMDIQQSDGQRNTEIAHLVHWDADLLIFVSKLPNSMWTYSIHKDGHLLVSQHAVNQTGGMSGKLMTGRCSR